jgi:hypothetical protein
MKRLGLFTPVTLAVLLAYGCTDRLIEPELEFEPTASRIAGADHGGLLVTADLTGAAEVPGPGDPDGSGTASVTLNHGQGEVCFEITVADIDPAFAAHIHIGTADVAGGVVVGLTAPTTGFSSGCVSGVDRDLIKAIQQNPAGYYVNVHNAPFPPGALRGQLMK